MLVDDVYSLYRVCTCINGCSTLAASSQSNGHNIHHIPTKTRLDVSNQELMLSEHEDIDVRGKVRGFYACMELHIEFLSTGRPVATG